MDNLRVKPGTEVSIGNITAEVLRWGPRVYLIQYFIKGDTKKSMRYGTLQRTAEDSSWGPRDVLRDNPAYNRYDSLESAEKAFEHANQ